MMCKKKVQNLNHNKLASVNVLNTPRIRIPLYIGRTIWQVLLWMRVNTGRRHFRER